jgi:hypothetical protein
MGWGPLGRIAHSVMHSVTHFVAKHWKTILVVGVSTIVFVAATALTGGLAGPALLALGGPILATATGLAVGGAASGLSAYLLGQWLDHRPITLKGALTAVAVSTVVSLATAGIGAKFAPVLTKAATPIVDDLIPAAANDALPNAARAAALGAISGGPLGATGQVLENAITGKPLGQNVGQAFAIGAITGATQAPLNHFLGEPITKAAAQIEEPGYLRGIVGELLDEPPGTTRTVGDTGTTPTTETSATPASGPRGVLGPMTPLDGLFPVDSFISEGNYKQTFTTDDPGLVVRVVKTRTSTGEVLDRAAQQRVLDEEGGMLARLDRDGVPAMKVVARGTVEIDGQVRAADVSERYAAGSKGPGNDAGTVNPDFLRYANETTVQDLARIRTTLDQKGLVVADISFLIKSDGHVVVGDPLGIYATREVPSIEPLWKRSFAQYSPRTIELTENAVRKAVAARATAASSP